MNRNNRMMMLAAVVVILLAACAPGSPAPPEPTARPVAAPTTTASPTPEPSPTPEDRFARYASLEPYKEGGYWHLDPALSAYLEQHEELWDTIQVQIYRDFGNENGYLTKRYYRDFREKPEGAWTGPMHDTIRLYDTENDIEVSVYESPSLNPALLSYRLIDRYNLSLADWEFSGAYRTRKVPDFDLYKIELRRKAEEPYPLMIGAVLNGEDLGLFTVVTWPDGTYSVQVSPVEPKPQTQWLKIDPGGLNEQTILIAEQD